MTKLDKAKNILDQYDSLVKILDKFYWDGGIGHTMYFTVEECEVIAEYLINEGVTLSIEKENE